MTSQAFRPTKKDENRLSVDNGDMVSAEEAYRSFSESHESIGVLAVSVAECETQKLQAIPDPIEGRESHTAIDFSFLSSAAVRRAAERLRDDATKRGWQYRPELAP